MRKQWKKVAMIMLVGLLVAGPLAQIHQAAAQQESAGMMNAKAMNDKAAAELHNMMMQMDSMMKMPMSANEKHMMDMMHQMAMLMQMLIDINKNLIAAMEHGNK